MFGYGAEIAFYLKVTGRGLLSYMFVSDSGHKTGLMQRFEFHILM